MSLEIKTLKNGCFLFFFNSFFPFPCIKGNISKIKQNINLFSYPLYLQSGHNGEADDHEQRAKKCTYENRMNMGFNV